MASKLVLRYVLIAILLSLICIWLSYFAYSHTEWEREEAEKYTKKLEVQSEKIKSLEFSLIDHVKEKELLTNQLKTTVEEYQGKINTLVARAKTDSEKVKSLEKDRQHLLLNHTAALAAANTVVVENEETRILTPHLRSYATKRKPNHTIANYDDIANFNGDVLHIISHTHWDREWYLSFETFRGRLVKLLDDVIYRLETDEDFKHFHLDGQFIVVDDYLQVRTSYRDRIEQANLNGQISLGPWYVQPDEYLVSAEALVRNLMLGIRKSEEMGGTNTVGYIPDSFGHVGQMPQILRLFDISTAMSGRGLPPKAKTEVFWESPDGSKVLFVFLKNWYCNGLDMPTHDANSVANWARGQVQNMKRSAATRHVLAMNGCDHTAPDPKVGDAIVAASEQLEKQNNIKLVHSSLDDYMKLVEQEVEKNGNKLEYHHGEMRFSVESLANTLSNKIHQKQMNWRVQTLLEAWVEPLATISWKISGKKYDQDTIWYGWKLLLENHPHDSICGCSSMDVHREVDERFEKCNKVAEQSSSLSLIKLLKSISPSGHNLGDIITVFNPTNFPRKEVFIFEYDGGHRNNKLKIQDVTDGHDDHKIFNVDSIFDVGYVWTYTLPDVGFRNPFSVQRARFAFEADVPAFGYTNYKLIQSDQKADESSSRKWNSFKKPNNIEIEKFISVLENEYLFVGVNSDGTIFIHQKEENINFNNLNKLEDTGDSGDQYYFRHGGGPHFISGSATIISQKYYRSLSFVKILINLKTSQGDLPIHIIYLLKSGSRRLEILTAFDNTKTSHRVRALFNSGLNNVKCLVDGQFEVLERSSHSYQPQCKFVSLHSENDKIGFTIANKGLPEYQHNGGNIALTLIRSTDQIGDWGRFPVPTAQEQGLHWFEYAIIPHKDNVQSCPYADLEARAFNWQLRGVQGKNVEGYVPEPLIDFELSDLLTVNRIGGVDKNPNSARSESGDVSPDYLWKQNEKYYHAPGSDYFGEKEPIRNSFIEIWPSWLVLSSVKKAEDRETVIVRFFNPYATEVEAVIKTRFAGVQKAYLTNLNEKRLSNKPLVKGSDSSWKVKVGNRKIITVELE